jgi:hypothetical protein
MLRRHPHYRGRFLSRPRQRHERGRYSARRKPGPGIFRLASRLTPVGDLGTVNLAGLASTANRISGIALADLTTSGEQVLAHDV